MIETTLPPHDAALAATAAATCGDTTPSGDHAPADLVRGTLVGRYVVLAKLGAGGMGVVYAAYDPELDRKVALKFLHPRLVDADPFTTGEARTRLVREAQALAKLNNPHIVAVHDAGEHQGAVWLAMEYVDGETLSAWLKQRRTWREVLDVLTPAVRGLSAAHQAGLVHRDIKPDNLMLGADGRVRVMDLGLVRALGVDGPAAVAPDVPTGAGPDLAALAAQVTRVGSVLGTPAYMSPEQFRGETVDARTDVFSLCVTLWEALMGERPFAGATLIELASNVLAGRVRPVPRDAHSRRVPGWLRRACLQGLAADPGRRFVSMQALLDGLSQGRTRARARRWLVGIAAVAVLGGSVAMYQRHDRAGRIAACEADGADISEVWNDEAQAGVRDGILSTGVSYAPLTAEKVMPFLDAQAEAWREHRTRACLAAEVEETLSPDHLDRAVWCLDERRMELAALVTELTHADVTAVQMAVTAAASLPPVSPCLNGQVLAALPSPPPVEVRERADAVRTTLSKARTSSWTGRYPEGLKQSRTALADAEALGWPPITAATRQFEGSLLERTGAYTKAEAASIMAYMESAKVQSWDVAASAALDLTFNVGYRQARYAEGRVWAGHAEVAVLLAGDPLHLHKARLLGSLASIHHAMGEYTEAKTLHEQALAIRETTLGLEHPYLASTINNLAIVHNATGAYAEAKALYERALAIREQAQGPEHPDVASSLNNLAANLRDTGAYAEAKALNERALAIWEKALGPEHNDVATALSNLANVHLAMGTFAEAKALSERALAIREKALGPEHPRVATSIADLANIYQHMGAYLEAKALNERALAIREKALGPEHSEVADSLNNLANNHKAMGAYTEARMLHERALAIREKALGPEHPRVADSLNNLALIQKMTGAYVEAKRLEERTLAIREKALGPGHPDVADSLNNLANTLKDLGEYREAKALHERALVIREKAMGPEHPDMAYSLGNLALVCQDMGEYAEARALNERALAIQEKALGPEHLEVAFSLRHLGEVALEQHQDGEARTFLTRAVAIYDAHEGIQENELWTRFCLARALLRTGDRARGLAERYLSTILRHGGE